MSDYIVITDYAAKDNLLTGNPAKLVKGAEIGADFDAVAVAVATKADTNSPILVTPNLGVATATSINKVTITAPATSATLTVANGKTLTASNTLTLAGTDSTTMTFPATSGTVLTAALQNAITNPSNLSVNLGTGALTAGSGTFSGTINSTKDGQLFARSGSNTTGWNFEIFNNGNRTYLGGESLAGGTLMTGSTSYATVLCDYRASGHVQIGTTSMVCDISSTGLSVTGTLSATGAATIGGNAATGTYVAINDSSAANAYWQIAGASKLQIKSTSGTNLINALANGFEFQIADSTKLTLDASGNLGLGVTPSAWRSSSYVMQLGSQGSVSAGYGQVALSANAYVATGGTNTKIANDYATNYYQYQGAHVWQNAASGTGTFSWTTAMTLDASGTLKNTSSGATVGWSAWTQNTHASTPSGLFIEYTAFSPNNTSSEFLYCRDGGATLRAAIRSNGGLANYSANNVNLSDERLKKDFNPAPSYYDRWKQIDFVTYLYKDQTDTELNLGVKAQQLETVCPELVDNSGFGEAPEGEAPYKAVYQTDFAYATAVALQEAIKKIDELTTRIAQLEAKCAGL